MQGLKNVRRLLEKQRWVLLCAAILTIAAVTVSLVLLYAPRETEPPPEETEPAETAAVSAPPPTAAPEPAPTATPVITPPAQNAASGSDVILNHVPSSSGSDLSAGGELAPEPGSETGE